MKTFPASRMGSILMISMTLFCLYVNVINGQELNFFDDNGNVFTLTLSGGCYNFKPKWDKRASSIEVDEGHCYNAWDQPDCKGGQLLVKHGARGMRDLKQVNFDKSISSVNLCSPDQAEHAARNNSGMIDVKNSGYKASPVSRTNLQEVRDAAVEEHNKYRLKHGVPPLTGDEELHEEAQKYADKLASTHRFEPSRTYRYGENLATSYRRNKVDAVKDAIKRWYDKIKNYDYERPGYNVGGVPSGSFTAVVWKTTTKLGIGIAWDEIEEAYVIVAFYEPQGLESSELLELEGVNSGKTFHLQFSEHLHRALVVFFLLGVFNSAVCNGGFQDGL